MIRAGFLSEVERQALIVLARDGLAEHRIARRANAIVLLDTGWSCAKVASALRFFCHQKTVYLNLAN
jgi:hypothetical protein